MVNFKNKKKMSIEVENVNYSIAGNHILKNICLKIESGKILTLLGPNGAGKSSLIGLIAGDFRPNAGTIFYNKQNLNTISLDKKAKLRAVMSQSQSIGFDYTVQEIFEMGWITDGIKIINSNFVKKRNAIAKKCNIKNLLKRKFNTLSGGEKKRVHFARTLLQLWSPVEYNENRFLILDEPLNDLDLYYEIQTMEIIKDVAKSNIGIVMILHDLNLAAKYSDQLVILSKGSIQCYGTPAKVFTEKNLSKTFNLKMKIKKNPLRTYYF